MSGKVTLGDIRGRMHHNLAQSEMRVKKSGLSNERRMYLDHCLVRRGQPHLSEPEVLEVRNRPFKVLPPTHLRMCAIPRKELDLFKV